MPAACRYYVLPKKVEQAFEDGSLFNPRSAPVARGIEDDAALAAEDEDVEDTMVRLLRQCRSSCKSSSAENEHVLDAMVRCIQFKRHARFFFCVM